MTYKMRHVFKSDNKSPPQMRTILLSNKYNLLDPIKYKTTPRHFNRKEKKKPSHKLVNTTQYSTD